MQEDLTKNGVENANENQIGVQIDFETADSPEDGAAGGDIANGGTSEMDGGDGHGALDANAEKPKKRNNNSNNKRKKKKAPTHN